MFYYPYRKFLYSPEGNANASSSSKIDTSSDEYIKQQANKAKEAAGENAAAEQAYDNKWANKSNDEINSLLDSTVPGTDYTSSTFVNRFDDQPGITNPLTFEIPEWGAEDYINERSMWVKGLCGVTDEPGWFYFKVFFNFKTNFGLFGGLFDIENKQTFSGNSALRFLHEINGGYYQERPSDRINALRKFAGFLSKINTQYPWIIKSISNLGSTFKSNWLSDNYNEEQKITLTFGAEHVDMKLLNMLSLYKYICYDDYGCKEIIPSNIRKFDMMVVLYHVPIKYFQTGIMVAKKNTALTTFGKTWLPGTVMDKVGGALDIAEKTLNFLTSQSNYYAYKRMSPRNGDFSNMLSFHMMTFQNCEFDINSFQNYFDAGAWSTENPTQVSDVNIDITFDKVYHHTMNEWNQYLFGVDGFYFDGFHDSNSSSALSSNKHQHENRLNSLRDAWNSGAFFDKNAGQYKALIDYTESIITDGLLNMNFDRYYLYEKGNIYGDVNIGSNFHKYRLSLQKGLGYMGNLFGGSVSSNNISDGRKRYDSYLRDKISENNKPDIKGNIYGNLGPENKNKNASYFYKKLAILKDSSNRTEKETELKSIYTSESSKSGLQILSSRDKNSKDAVNMKNYIPGPMFGQRPKTALEWLREQNNNKIAGWENIKNGFMGFFGMSKNDWKN